MVTIEDIELDIQNLHERMQAAKKRMEALPEGQLYPVKATKARDLKKKALTAEIEHCERLIGYANEGLELMHNESDQTGHHLKRHGLPGERLFYK